MLYKSLPMEIKVKDIDKGEFEGYASVFDVIDSYKDVVHRGAFSKSLKENKKKIKVMYMHSKPFGKPTEIYEDDYGLFTRTKATPTQENKDRLAYIRDGVVDGLSIGYDLIEGKYERDEKGIQHLYEVRLWEYSPVVWGANPLADIKGESVAVLTKSLRRIGDGYLNNDLGSVKSAIEDIKNIIGEPSDDTHDDDIADIASLCEDVGSYAEAMKMKQDLEAFAKSIRR